MEETVAAVKEGFDQWAIVELMGHVKIAGHVTEAEIFGAKMGRVDIPNADGGFTTQYFSGGSVYRLTPTTEEIARAVAVRNQPAPVYTWDLPKALTAGSSADDDFDEDDE
jgi:hypothetical protein